MNPEINRLTWRYWVDGNGHWINRWDGTQGDWFLLLVMAIGILWMIGEYVWYARQVTTASQQFLDPARRQHLHQLMRVFLFCCLIHVFNLVNWFWPAHLLWSVSYFVNAAFAHKLNRGFGAAVEKSLSDSLAESRLKDIGDRLDTVYLGDDLQPPQKTLRELAEELRRMI